MAEVNLILATHLAYFRRHPWLLLLFVVGLSLGSALLTGIAGLNQEARQRHQTSSALIDSAISHIIQPPVGQQYLDGSLWLKLRQHGFTNAQPVLRGRVKLASGKTLYLQGIDSLMWLNNAKFDKTEQAQSSATGFAFDRILLDRNYADRLGIAAGSRQLKLLNKDEQPKIQLVDDIGIWSVTDLAYADALLNAKGQLSFIELSELKAQQIPELEAILANEARLTAAQQQDFDALSEAFFFNLTALALLGYIVAAFLSFNAIKLSLAARQTLLTQFHLLGCTRRALLVAIAIEFMTLSLLTAMLGSLAGFAIANALVIDVNRTLMGLYQLQQALTVKWQWQSFALGFVVNLATLGVMLLSQSKVPKRGNNRLFYFVLTSVVVALSYLYVYAQSEFDALLLCFFILLAFVVTVPKLLQALLSFNNPFTRPVWQWLYADSKFQLQELRIAIVAILVALGSAIGMQVMVKSFNNTLNAHLEKQLSADLYIGVENYQPSFRAELMADDRVARVGIYMAATGYINNIPADLISFGQGGQAFSHISLLSGQAVGLEHFAEQGCVANEQAKIKYGYQLGDTVAFQQNQHSLYCRITGFYYDYGNTSLALLTQEQRLQQSPLTWQVYGLSLTLAPGVDSQQMTQRLLNQYQLSSHQISANKKYKEVANRLFNDTFKVTKVLNGFILAIALVSLCISLLSLSAQHGKQLAVLHQLGVSTSQLQQLKLVQTSLLVGFTCLCAIPLGLALGMALLKFVMPIAFGWTIHFNLDLSALLTTCLLLFVCAICCAYLPVKKLAPASLAKGH